MPKNMKVKAVPEYTLQDIFVNKLKSLYDVETQLIKSLPKMAKKASDADLKLGFENHLKQTEKHAERIEHAFDVLGLRTQKLQSEAI
jgi:ferritin-like metal-binding protein YciE